MPARRSLLLAALATPALAQPTWPTRPVRILVGFPAGGPTDLPARLLQEPLQRIWGQPVVVENRPGASQIIASEAIARSAPDGYNLLLAASTHSSNPATQARLPYDTMADFTLINVLYGSPTVLFVPGGSPIRSAAELVAEARRSPGMTFATSGPGTSGHFAQEMFARRVGIEVTHVPFRGAAPALQEVVSGRIAATFSTLAGAMPLAREGRIRAIAVGGPQRAPVLPDVPTLDELGMGIPDTSPWYGFIGPRGMPRELVQKISDDSIALIREPGLSARIRDTGGILIAEGPDAFHARMLREIEENREMARVAGLTPS
jgi:tripartite-type tricarboxylate transporter receptor subunit TctC